LSLPPRDIHRSPFQAIAAGNTFLLKPSEKDAGAAVMLAEMAVEAGMPPGVLNVVHGTVDTVNFLCDDERIKVKGDGDGCYLGCCESLA
jgi:malonate-semialdehyde dehydrogenase (acetylating)/methylmalonate-semialdehyde dehydrogenase